jgi:hypothetical protein
MSKPAINTSASRKPFQRTLPRYCEYNQNTPYLELHQNRTSWKLDNPAKDDEEFNILVQLAANEFESKTGVTIFFLGRSGRHICIEDTPENSKRYRNLQRLAFKLEQSVIDEFNAPDSEPADPTYSYYINLDERGTFYADVRRDSDETTVYEIKIDNDEENDSTIFEDGYMKHKNDISGLEEYLKSLSILESNSVLSAA